MLGEGGLRVESLSKTKAALNPKFELVPCWGYIKHDHWHSLLGVV